MCPALTHTHTHKRIRRFGFTCRIITLENGKWGLGTQLSVQKSCSRNFLKRRLGGKPFEKSIKRYKKNKTTRCTALSELMSFNSFFSQRPTKFKKGQIWFFLCLERAKAGNPAQFRVRRKSHPLSMKVQNLLHSTGYISTAARQLLLFNCQTVLPFQLSDSYYFSTARCSLQTPWTHTHTHPHTHTHTHTNTHIHKHTHLPTHTHTHTQSVIS